MSWQDLRNALPRFRAYCVVLFYLTVAFSLATFNRKALVELLRGFTWFSFSFYKAVHNIVLNVAGIKVVFVVYLI